MTHPLERDSSLQDRTNDRTEAGTELLDLAVLPEALFHKMAQDQVTLVQTLTG